MIAKLYDENACQIHHVKARFECGRFQISYVEGRSELNGHTDRSLHAQTCDLVVGGCLLGQIGCGAMCLFKRNNGLDRFNVRGRMPVAREPERRSRVFSLDDNRFVRRSDINAQAIQEHDPRK